MRDAALSIEYIYHLIIDHVHEFDMRVHREVILDLYTKSVRCDSIFHFAAHLETVIQYFLFMRAFHR